MNVQQRTQWLVLLLMALLATVYFFNEISPSLNLGVDRWVKPVRFPTDGPIGLEFAFLQRDLRQGVVSADGLQWWPPLAYIVGQWGGWFSSPMAFSLLTLIAVAAMLLALWLTQGILDPPDKPSTDLLPGGLAVLMAIFFITTSFVLPLAIYRGRHDIVLVVMMFLSFLLVARQVRWTILLPLVLGIVIGWNVAWLPMAVLLWCYPNRRRNTLLLLAVLLISWSLLGVQPLITHFGAVARMVTHAEEYFLFNHSLFGLYGAAKLAALGVPGIILALSLGFVSLGLAASSIRMLWQQAGRQRTFCLFVAMMLLSYALAPVSYDFRLVALFIFILPFLQHELQQILTIEDRLALWRLIFLVVLLAWLARSPWTNVYYIERSKFFAILLLQFYLFDFIKRQRREVLM